MKHLLPILSVLLIAACGTTPDEAVVRTFQEKMRSHESMSYDIEYHFKPRGSTDTIRRVAAVTVVRDTTDSLVGGHVWISQDTIVHYYDTEHLYIIHHNGDTILKTNSQLALLVEDHTLYSLYRTFFLRPELLNISLNHRSATQRFGQSEVNGRIATLWEWKRFDESASTEIQQATWFDAGDSDLLRRIHRDSNTVINAIGQHQEWLVTNTQYDERDAEDLRRFLRWREREYTTVMLDSLPAAQ